MRKYFGTDGIRRIANTELSPELVYKVAKAGAYVLSKHTDHTPTIFIGRDTRISGTLIEAAMTAGFLSYGANVKQLGVIPTPGVAYLTKRYKADASVVISASHNTYEFNGIKFFSNKGMKIPDTLEEDITRRDFTVNSICMDKDGKIIDLLNGKKDLNKKIIRTIGDASFKIKQDSLRILRAIRFASCLNFKIEDSLKKAIKENKDLLKTLSYERKKEELTKIFTSDNKAYGVKLLKELDLLDVLELTNIDNVLRTKDLIGMWSTITVNDNYPFTKKEKELINNMNVIT